MYPKLIKAIGKPNAMMFKPTLNKPKLTLNKHLNSCFNHYVTIFRRKKKLQIYFRSSGEYFNILTIWNYIPRNLQLNTYLNHQEVIFGKRKVHEVGEHKYIINIVHSK